MPEDLVDALAQLSFLVHNTLAEIAAAHDLSMIQTRLLGILRDREPTMQDLGRHLGLDKSSVTGLVTRAERRGLVTRTISPTDRRAYHVSITEAGRTLATKAAAEFTDRMDAYVSDLTAEDRRQLAVLADRIIQRSRTSD